MAAVVSSQYSSIVWCQLHLHRFTKAVPSISLDGEWKYYSVFSIEHDQSWIGKYNTHYIYAPIKNGWYDIEILKRELLL